MLLYFIDDPRITTFIFILTILIFINAIIISKCNDMKEKIDMDNMILEKINRITTEYGTDKILDACDGDIDLLFTIVTFPMLVIDRLVKYNKLLVIRKAAFTGTVTFIVVNILLGLILS